MRAVAGRRIDRTGGWLPRRPRHGRAGILGARQAHRRFRGRSHRPQGQGRRIARRGAENETAPDPSSERRTLVDGACGVRSKTESGASLSLPRYSAKARAAVSRTQIAEVVNVLSATAMKKSLLDIISSFDRPMRILYTLFCIFTTLFKVILHYKITYSILADFDAN